MTFQAIPYPLSSLSFKSIFLQFRDKDVVGDHIKGLAEVQVDDIHCPSPIHLSHHSIIEGQQIGQVQSDLCEAMLAVSNHFFISYVP